jgi:hypothetical protein
MAWVPAGRMPRTPESDRREAEDFDAVPSKISGDEDRTLPKIHEELAMAFRCPSTIFRLGPVETPGQKQFLQSAPSTFPLAGAIRLVPHRPLKADLLVAADCTPVAYPTSTGFPDEGRHGGCRNLMRFRPTFKVCGHLNVAGVKRRKS